VLGVVSETFAGGEFWSLRPYLTRFFYGLKRSKFVHTEEKIKKKGIYNPNQKKYYFRQCYNDTKTFIHGYIFSIL